MRRNLEMLCIMENILAMHHNVFISNLIRWHNGGVVPDKSPTPKYLHLKSSHLPVLLSITLITFVMCFYSEAKWSTQGSTQKLSYFKIDL